MAASTIALSAAVATPRFQPAVGGAKRQHAARHRRGASLRCAASSNTSNPRFALLFDCDGVIVETEELHRRAYCGAFEAFDLKIKGEPVVWTVEYYDILANTVGGGKPKMRWHFGKNAWPDSDVHDYQNDEEAQTKLVDDLQDKKTELYKEIVEVAAEARPGVLRLMDEAISRPDIAVGICSAATKAGFEKVVNSVVGKERLDKMDVVMAGDDVTKKKPDPLIYNLAREKIGLPADKCVVIEDSMVGLRAALGADMYCIITPTHSTDKVDFVAEGANVCMDCEIGLGDNPPVVTLDGLFPAGAETPVFPAGAVV